MRRLWIALLGIGALVALRARRSTGAAGQAPPADLHAGELKRKLAEAREAAADREEFEAAETPVDEAEASVDARRRGVHDAARDVIASRAPDDEGPEAA